MLFYPQFQAGFIPSCFMVEFATNWFSLIQRGGGTGPAKPRQPRKKLVPNPAESATADILEDEADQKEPTLSIQRGFLLSTGIDGRRAPWKENIQTASILDALKQRVLIFDGAMGTNLQKMNLTAKEFGGEKTDGCNDYLVLSLPPGGRNSASLLPRGRSGCYRDLHLPLQPHHPGRIWSC